MNLFAVDNVIPDLVFYIDVEADHGLSRARNSSRKQMNYSSGDRIELEGVAFHRKVREGYRELAARHPDLFITIDATGRSREELGNIIYSQWRGRVNHD